MGEGFHDWTFFNAGADFSKGDTSGFTLSRINLEPDVWVLEQHFLLKKPGPCQVPCHLVGKSSHKVTSTSHPLRKSILPLHSPNPDSVLPYRTHRKKTEPMGGSAQDYEHLEPWKERLDRWQHWLQADESVGFVGLKGVRK